MTQIIGAITKQCVLIATDRRLMFVDGPRKGSVADDDTCKLVSLCNICGIAYSGLAKLQGRPTHEWIALRLAEKGCQDPGVAARLIRDAASVALKEEHLVLEQSFLITGWGLLKDGKTLQAHFRVVSNSLDQGLRRLPAPGTDFRDYALGIREGSEISLCVIGQRLVQNRGKALVRFLTRFVQHEVSPKEAMLALVKEVVFDSQHAATVGSQVLCYCIPRVAAERAIQTGSTMMLAMEPDLHTAAFCYFDPTYSELRQYGPTFTCGETAMTDVETVTDPARDFQSASMKFLHLPSGKPKESGDNTS